MELSNGFAALSSRDAKILILGSLPGQRSIQEQQYYAHPRNAFWRIVREVFAIQGSYADRCTALVGTKIALWDVLQASIRPGSLDSDIKIHTAKANDFSDFFAQHHALGRVLLNGKKAQQLFDKFVQPEIYSTLEVLVMPSTSPAYASMPYAEKLAIWRNALTSEK